MANPRRRGLTTNGILDCLEDCLVLETTDPVLDEWSEDEPRSSDESGESDDDGESLSEPEGGGVIGVPPNDGGSMEGEVGAGGSTHGEEGEEGLLREVGGEEGLLMRAGSGDPGPGGEEGIMEVGFSESIEEDLNFGRIPTTLPQLHLDLSTPGNNK